VSIRLSTDEAWEVLSAAHTGIFTTLKRDGWPISLPVWFVVQDRTICMAPPTRTKKVGRVRKDPRASFLVESGERWAELQAVHLTGYVSVIDDTAEKARIDAALDEKYRAFRSARTSMPEATQAHYADRTFLRLLPQDRILSWDNRRMRLTP
jgi:nitroimidazol reductase NimA-like FMN-containing flavoprotein (pyridoxamine 5'-phosphate oxidase superfamily)